MKNLLFAAIATILTIGLTSCGKEGGCKTCETNAIILVVKQEICDDGKGGVNVTTDGQTENIPNITVEKYTSELVSASAGLTKCN
jgi:hypothetical protein